MDNKQIEMIVGMMAGLQAAYAETVKELEKSGLISAKAVAARLEAHAASIPEEVRGRNEIMVMLKQLARLLSDGENGGGDAPPDAGNSAPPAGQTLQ